MVIHRDRGYCGLEGLIDSSVSPLYLRPVSCVSRETFSQSAFHPGN